MSETKYGVLQEDIDDFDLEVAEDQRITNEKRAHVIEHRPSWLGECKCDRCCNRCKESN